MAHYPALKLLLIDNGSADDSSAFIAALAERYAHVCCLLNSHNRFHGPALDQGMHASSTQLVLTLDSDSEVIKPGLLEKMCVQFLDSNVYAVGKLIDMDWFGYGTPELPFGRFPYIHPYCSLLDREKYLRLKGFFHHGSPGIENMRHAWRKGYGLKDFPVERYVIHSGRGTCSQFGYGLGPRHTAEYILRQVLIKLLDIVDRNG